VNLPEGRRPHFASKIRTPTQVKKHRAKKRKSKPISTGNEAKRQKGISNIWQGSKKAGRWTRGGETHGKKWGSKEEAPNRKSNTLLENPEKTGKGKKR